MKKLLITLFVFCLLTVSAHAETDRIKISGTVDASSILGIKKAFGNLPTVETVNVDSEKMLITVKIKDGQGLSLEDEKKAITDNGLILVSVLSTGY